MSDKSEHTNFDNIETLLLMAMSVSPEYQESQKVDCPGSSFGQPGEYKQIGDAGSWIGADDCVPERAYTFDVDSDRLYTTDKSLLLEHPFDIIGRKMETMLLAGDRMKWSMLEETKKPEKFYSVGRADKWFVFHYRTYSSAGVEEYHRDIVPMNKKGNVLPFRSVQGFKIKGPTAIETQQQIVMSCSIIEDAHRPGTLLAECSCDSSLIFPVAYGAHKDFLALREGPKQTPTGRRNPILHFVRKHLRSSGTEIAKHWRGVDEVEISGMKLKLSSQEAEL